MRRALKRCVAGLSMAGQFSSANHAALSGSAGGTCSLLISLIGVHIDVLPRLLIVLFFADLRDPQHYLGGWLALAIGRFDTVVGRQALSGWIDYVCRRR